MSAVLIDEDRIAIRVDDHDTRRSFRPFVGLGGHLDTGSYQLFLQIAHVGE